jgi:mono/diheme cytochrome c family protein
MRSKKLMLAAAIALFVVFFTNCNYEKTIADSPSFAGYESQVKWGEHLITVGGCGDCHTPKKMGPMGPEDDSTLMLSGHPSQMPLPDIDRGMLESKGMAATQTLTFWIGPWGVSYAANLTPDSTGLLAWTEEQFINALKFGYSKGIKENRMLLPPMPFQVTKHLKEEEIKAMFAYLKTIKPVKNAVPQPLPPVMPPPPPQTK